MQPMTEETRSICADGATLAAQSFGVPNDPAVILVMGATASMLGWPDALCRGLAAHNLFVVRYDHRDTGLSTTYPPGTPPYAVEDLAVDLLAVLDAYGKDKAHVVGMSLGGLIAQVAALSFPQRVQTLTLIGSEPLGWDGEPLPHIQPAFLDHFAALAKLDWTDADKVRKFLLEVERLCAGPGHTFDAGRAQAKVDAVMKRSCNLASSFNHGAVQLRNDWRGRFRDIAQPTLVIHGEEDPILPVQNGKTLASSIFNSRLKILPGVGHELPQQFFGDIIEEITTLAKQSMT
jgi:pimeloyl-ACP methyl ester carboxylesterase